jgi:hypothetical protein
LAFEEDYFAPFVGASVQHVAAGNCGKILISLKKIKESRCANKFLFTYILCTIGLIYIVCVLKM